MDVRTEWDAYAPCPCGSGDKFKRCCGMVAELNPRSLLGRLVRSYQEIDVLNMRTKKQLPGLPCEPGCSACCTSKPFSIGSMEFLWMKIGLAKIDPQLKSIVFDNALIQREVINAANPEVLTTKHGGFTTTRGNMKLSIQFDDVMQQLAGKYSCPLLVDNCCTIYPHRPWLCRVYGTFKLGECSKIPCDIRDALPEFPFKRLEPSNVVGFDWRGHPIVYWLCHLDESSYKGMGADWPISSHDRFAIEWDANVVSLAGHHPNPSSLDEP